MKKSISLALSALMLMGTLSSCTALDAHSHTFDTAWEKDATNHWHVATCEHTTEKGDLGAHVDLDNNGLCDACGYGDTTHVHTYAAQWSANSKTHWHASECGHSVISDEAAHELNAVGDCVVCGADVSDPNVETVAAAVAVGVEQGDVVSAGKIKQVSKDVMEDVANEVNVDYEVAEGYAHIVSKMVEWDYFNEMYALQFTERWFSTYTVNDEVKVAAVERNSDGTLGKYWYDLTGEEANGYAFETLFYSEGTFFGVENLVEGLYALASANEVVNESVEAGVYSFAFQYVNMEYAYIFDVAVAFELGEAFNFENVQVSVTRYIDVVVEGEGDEAVYTLVEDAEAHSVTTYSVQQVVGESFAKENTADELLINDFTLSANDAEINVGTTLNMVAGEETMISMTNVAPETALFALDEPVITAFDAEGNELYDIYGYSYDGYVYLTAYATVDATVVITTAQVQKQFNVHVTTPAVEELYAEVNWAVVTEANVYAGKTMEFSVGVQPEYANSEYTVEVTSKPTGSTAVVVYDGLAETFTPDVLGDYVITITSVENNAISTTLTVHALAKPNLTEKFVGVYAYDDGWSTLLVTFAESNTLTAEFSGYNRVGQLLELTETMTYEYNSEDDSIVLTHVSGDEGVLNSLEFDADYNFYAYFNNYSLMGTLTEYTAPTAIQEIAGEWAFIDNPDEYPIPTGNVRYKLAIEADGSATLEYATWDPNNGEWGAYVLQGSATMTLSAEAFGDGYAITIEEISASTIDGFDEMSMISYTVVEEEGWWGTEYVPYLVITIGGVDYQCGIF